MKPGKATTKDAYGGVPTQDLVLAPPGESAQTALETEITAKFGICPNVFRGSEDETDTLRSLWAFTKSAYLDNPLPSLFKERLFVHLSRFCPWHYCVARHAAFLLGRGHPAGDHSARRHSVEEIVTLLSGPGRLEGEDLNAALSRLVSKPKLGIPEPGSREETDIFVAATAIFLQLEDSATVQEILREALGPLNFDLLLTFLTFVRAIHYWTSTHRIAVEEDVEALLRDHEELASLLMKRAEPENTKFTRRLQDEIKHLRKERDERDEAARQAEFLQLALDATNQGAWEYDLAAGIPTWDAKACMLFGRSVPIACKRVVDELIHPDDRARVSETLDAALDPAGDGRYREEYRVIRPNGETRWLSNRGRTLFAGEGRNRRAVRMIGIVRDITEHKQAEDALRESERRYRTLFDSIDEGFGIIEMVFDDAGRPVDYRFLEINAAFGRQTGLTGAVGKTARELVPGLEEHWFEIYGRIARTGCPERFERAAASLGRYYEVYGFRLGEPHENRVGVLFKDITERKATESALAESEERLAAALKGGKLGIYDYDPRSRRGKWDETTRRFWGVAPDEPLTYDSFTAGVHPDDLPAVEEALNAAYDPQGERTYAAEYRIINRQTGEMRWVRAEGDVTFENGEAARLVGTIVDVTPQKTAEVRLRESERRLKRLLDQLFTFVAVLTPEGTVVQTNRAPLEALGLTLEEVLGKPFDQLSSWSWDKDVQKQLRHAMRRAARGEAVRYDVPQQIADGRLMMIDFQIAPMWDDEGHIIGLIASANDIDDRVAAEQALRESEVRFRKMADDAPVMIWVSERDGSCSYVNKRWLEFTGQTAEEGLGFGWLNAVHPDDRERTQNTYLAAYNNRAAFRIDYRLRRKDGVYCWAIAAAQPRFGSNQQFLGYMGSILDITKRKQIELALREREERLAAVLTAADLGSWHWNIQADKVEINRRYAEMLGYDHSELKITYPTFASLVHPEDVPRVETALRDHFGGKTDLYSVEIRLRHKQGQWIWILASGRLIERDGAGRPLIMTGVHQNISGRVEAVQALREREERLAAVLRAADLGSWHWNIQADEVGINQRYAEMLGYDRSELTITYPKFLSLVHPEDVCRVETALQSYLEGKTNLYNVEIRMRHKDGHWVWISGSGRVIERDDAGRPLIMTGVHQDISRRIKAVQALRESEERFRHLANAAPVLIWMSGPDKLCTWFNRPWLNFVGRSMEEELGSGWTENVHPDDLERVMETYGTAFDAHKPFSMEYRLRQHDGVYRWLLDKGIPRYGAHSEFTGYVGTCLDITENKQIEFALREREEKFRLLADNMSQFAWMADATGWIYWYNKRWFDYTGTTLEEMQGWGWRKVHHPDHVERVVKKIAEHFVTGEAWEDTFPLRGKDGEYRWFLSRAVPIRNEKGGIVRWFGTNTDLTERLRAEQHRELLLNELNHRVKNTLAIVQGIARQTFKDGDNAHRELMRSFQNRLAALAGAHNLLTRSNWEWTSLKELAIESIHQGCGQDAHVRIKGPPVVLKPKQAVTFAMALHELCTNATKYGALSALTGRIDVTWTVSDGKEPRRLKLIWREYGGPVVKLPTRRGFGLRMIEQALAGELDGKAKLEFRPEGLVCTIEGTLEKYGSVI